MFESISKPGGAMACALECAVASGELVGLSDVELRDVVVSAEKVSSWAQSVQAQAVAEIATRSEAATDVTTAHVGDFLIDPQRFLADELGAELAVSRGSATAKLDIAQGLAEHRTVRNALSHGLIDVSKAREIIEHLARVESPEFLGTITAAAIEYATSHTRPQLRAWLRRRIIAVEPEAAERRRQAAKDERKVRFWAIDDGMSTLQADLPSEQALAIYRTIDQLAHASCAEARSLDRMVDALPESLRSESPVPHVTHDGRSMDQRRADAFADLVLGNAESMGMLRGVAVTQARVVIDADTLAGTQQNPGELAGYGPITAEHARELVDRDSRWRRLLTDSSGALLEVSPQEYRPGRQLAEFVFDRDISCRFPGCRRPASFTGVDLDHTVPFPEGPTVAENLAALCRSHHLLKTHTDWRVEQDDRGVLRWTTPSGRVFRTFPHRYRSGAPPGVVHPN